MASKLLATNGRVEPAVRRMLWIPPLPQIKRRSRPIAGGEAELLQQLGEIRRVPREQPLLLESERPRWM